MLTQMKNTPCGYEILKRKHMNRNVIYPYDYIIFVIIYNLFHYSSNNVIINRKKYGTFIWLVTAYYIYYISYFSRMNWYFACIFFSSSTVWSFSCRYVLVREIFGWVGSSSASYSPRREIYSLGCYGRCTTCDCFRVNQRCDATTRTTLTVQVKGRISVTTCNKTVREFFVATDV
jgi:hypothetical protein